MVYHFSQPLNSPRPYSSALQLSESLSFLVNKCLHVTSTHHPWAAKLRETHLSYRSVIQVLEGGNPRLNGGCRLRAVVTMLTGQPKATGCFLPSSPQGSGLSVQSCGPFIAPSLSGRGDEPVVTAGEIATTYVSAKSSCFTNIPFNPHSILGR